jgi:hypothetical protein
MAEGCPSSTRCRRVEWEKAKTHFDTNHLATALWNVSDLKPSEDELTAISNYPPAEPGALSF